MFGIIAEGGFMNEEDGLVFACVFDGRGGGRELDWDGVRSWRPSNGLLWLHLDRAHERVQRWLGEESGLETVVAESLLAEETRPHCETVGDGLVLFLRGVNLNPGADPEDMVSLRLWAEPQRVISIRRRKVMAVQDLRDTIAKGRGPKQPAELITMLAAKLVDRMAPVLATLDDEIDALEEEVLTTVSHELRRRLHGVRHQAIALRRYIAPQRDAMTRLGNQEVSWLGQRDRGRLRLVGDSVTRYVEDLDAARERAGVIQDELLNRISEQMNRNMYLLSIIAAIFLPLGLLTGLLGINVGGIPGAEAPYGFLLVCLLLLLLCAIEYWLFKVRKWI
jgi:zinc transporter